MIDDNLLYRGHPNGNDSADPAESEALRRLRERSAALQREESVADQHLLYVQEVLRTMSEDENCKKYTSSIIILLTLYPRLAYITHDDIRRIGCFSEDTLLAVKAPFGSTLEVPDPDEGMPPGRRRYEIQLTSRSGPIDVFLIQDNPVASNALPPSGLDSLPTTDMNDSELLTGHDDALLKHFQLPSDPYNFELKPGEGIGDLYGFPDMFSTSFASEAPTSTNNVKIQREL